MNKIYPGENKTVSFVVTDADLAAFNNNVVHPVCATFTLAREVEWSSRQFVIENKENDEEGVGTMLTINHHAPAFLGDQVIITATVESFEKNELICSYVALVDNRKIASGKTGQKILKKERLDRIFSNFEK